MDGESKKQELALLQTVDVPIEPPKVALTPKEQRQLERDRGYARVSIAGMMDAAQVGEELEKIGAIKVGAGHVMIANTKIAPLLDMMVDIAMDDELTPEARTAAAGVAQKLQDSYVRSLKTMNEIIDSKQLNSGKADQRRPGPPPSVNIHTQSVTISENNG